MPEAWELGPSSYTVDDVTIQFKINQVLVLPEYRGFQNVVHKVNFTMTSTVADFIWNVGHFIDLDINNIETFVSIDTISEQQIIDWLIDRFLGPNGLLHAKQSCLQVYNEQLRDRTAYYYPFPFLNTDTVTAEIPPTE